MAEFFPGLIFATAFSRKKRDSVLSHRTHKEQSYLSIITFPFLFIFFHFLHYYCVLVLLPRSFHRSRFSSRFYEKNIRYIISYFALSDLALNIRSNQEPCSNLEWYLSPYHKLFWESLSFVGILLIAVTAMVLSMLF